MHHLRLRADLDDDVLADIRGLLAETTRLEGHEPIGEHKYAHLQVGARGWQGVMAYDGDRLIGYAHLRWNPVGDHPRVAVEIVVHPDHREEGIQQRLVDATREAVAARGGGTMFLWVHRVEDAHRTLAIELGFRVQRVLAFMTRPLTHPVEVLPLPEGVHVRPYAGAEDDEQLLAVNNAAFPDHPENGNWDLAELHARMGRDWFDPAGLFLAFRGEQLLGFHWTKWHGHPADTPHQPEGEVYVLAIHPHAQGLGLGRRLLRVGLEHLRGRGCARAILYVDAASTPAVNLYRSEGFELAYHEVCYEDDVAPAEGTRPHDLLRPA